MSEPKENPLMEKIVSLCKRRGFIFQSSEIYGGINGFWDYGPLGAELKRNVKDLWWRAMTRLRDDVVGLEATIIMHPQIWKASGHVDTFADFMRECPITNKRVRADQVDPQSGLLHRFRGARSPSTGWTTDKPFAVLLKPNEKIEIARRRARVFYGLAGPWDQVGDKYTLELLEDPPEPLENSVDFHPETGCELTPARAFNLMFKTHYGPVESDDNLAYLRPETAQAIFAQFKNVLETSRRKIPFGIAQVGKAFRNEVTPRNFTFRSREFEQMELEFFIAPDEAIEAIHGRVAQPSSPGHPGSPQPDWGWRMWHQYWVEERIRFYESIGLPRTRLEEYWQKPAELAHYARATVDLLYQFPFGTQELEGIAARGDFDLSQHQRFSGKPMGVFDEDLRAAWSKLDAGRQQALARGYREARLAYFTHAGLSPEDAARQADEAAEGLARGHYIPHVIEPSAGVDRLVLALIAQAFSEDEVPDDKGKPEIRTVLRFHPRIAPVKVAVFPLLKNKPDLVTKARQVLELLRPHMYAFYDDAGAIGRRYRRQDEAGTPFGVTIDFETLGEKGPDTADTVTVRDRDTCTQQRLPIADLLPWLLSRIQ
ncbi:MAG: glycine--tRNA ligase [Verrucomicrobiae bacterium]|nr:glycine--tRNA ligase [Verrucomicrobiae bacterium]